MTAMTDADRDRLIGEALPMARWEARQVRHLPPAVSVDDLESAAGEALVGCLATYDPGSGLSFATYARAAVVRAIKAAVQAARQSAKRRRPLEVRLPSGDTVPRADRRAADPAATAAARDESPLARRPMTPGEIKAALPGPAEVAARVQLLRSALFAAVRVEDVQMVMQSVVARATAGDLAAAKTLLDLIGSGPAIQVTDKRRVIVHNSAPATDGPK